MSRFETESTKAPAAADDFSGDESIALSALLTLADTTNTASETDEDTSVPTSPPYCKSSDIESLPSPPYDDEPAQVDSDMDDSFLAPPPPSPPKQSSKRKRTHFSRPWSLLEGQQLDSASSSENTSEAENQSGNGGDAVSDDEEPRQVHVKRIKIVGLSRPAEDRDRCSTPPPEERKQHEEDSEDQEASEPESEPSSSPERSRRLRAFNDEPNGSGTQVLLRRRLGCWEFDDVAPPQAPAPRRRDPRYSLTKDGIPHDHCCDNCKERGKFCQVEPTNASQSLNTARDALLTSLSRQIKWKTKKLRTCRGLRKRKAMEDRRDKLVRQRKWISSMKKKVTAPSDPAVEHNATENENASS
ncbi:hypothetical protein HK102_000945 [Quaeritorhiza haematococci]|nr:hypothetical protein HK102_000945 [Quaeritorhiza haematococci]